MKIIEWINNIGGGRRGLLMTVISTGFTRAVVIIMIFVAVTDIDIKVVLLVQ